MAKHGFREASVDAPSTGELSRHTKEEENGPLVALAPAVAGNRPGV